MSPKPRVAVVTGASGGLGTATVAALRADGYHVLEADLTPGRAGVRPVDVAVESEVEDLAEQASAAGDLVAWVNAAGIAGSMSDLSGTSLAELERVLSTNLTGTFLGMRAALRVAERTGVPVAVVNFGSVASFVGAAAGPAYPISKHGVLGLTRCGAIEAGPSGSRVNAVCPGPIDAGMYGELKSLPTPDGRTLHDHMLAGVPLQRTGTAAEVGEAVRWLASDEAGYVNGAAFVIDGGMLATTGQGLRVGQEATR